MGNFLTGNPAAAGKAIGLLERWEFACHFNVIPRSEHLPKGAASLLAAV